MHNPVVITSIEDLAECGMRDSRIAVAARAGGWYLVGSRAAGFADPLSDWDTLIVSPTDDYDENPFAGAVDEIFRVERPTVQGRPTLDLHRRWRAVNAVDITVLGPRGCRQRERDRLAEWAFELGQATAITPPSEAAERYRARTASLFSRRRPRLAASAYASFRHARNEAVATLPRQNQTAQVVTASACVAHAARFWLLSAGATYPAEKWLIQALRGHAPAQVLGAMASAVDLRVEPAERFDALWQMWAAVDGQAYEHGMIVDSPFAPPKENGR